MDSSGTASASWPCVAAGSNYFHCRDSRSVLAYTDLHVVDCKVGKITDSPNIFCVSVAVNHAVVGVLALIMD